MNKQRDKLGITKPILLFCIIILMLLVLMSCSKGDNKKAALNVNKSSIVDKTFSDGFNKTKEDNTYENREEKVKKIEKIEEEKVDISKYIGNEKNNGDSSNFKNKYYGKYNLDGNDVLGNFEVSRNSIVFTPDNGHSKEVIHFSGIKNIDRFEHPNGKVDLTIEYGGEDKIIKNVSDEMFTNILLYTTK